jgi:hypothetical protein
MPDDGHGVTGLRDLRNTDLGLIGVSAGNKGTGAPKTSADGVRRKLDKWEDLFFGAAQSQ